MKGENMIAFFGGAFVTLILYTLLIIPTITASNEKSKKIEELKMDLEFCTCEEELNDNNK